MYIHVHVSGRVLCLEYRVSGGFWPESRPQALVECPRCSGTWSWEFSSPTRGSSFFLTALGVLCFFALFVCLTLLASFFLPSHISLTHVHTCICSHSIRVQLKVDTVTVGLVEGGAISSHMDREKLLRILRHQVPVHNIILYTCVCMYIIDTPPSING